MSMVQSVKDPVARRFLDQKLGDIRRSFDPAHIILFGSRATGKAGESSDIDLIIVSERFKDVPFPNRMGAFLRAIKPEPDVEAFCYTLEEFDSLREQISPVAEAAREGIWIQ